MGFTKSWRGALPAIIGAIIITSTFASAAPIALSIDGQALCSERVIRIQSRQELYTPFPEFFLAADTSRISAWFADRGYQTLELYHPRANPAATVYSFNTPVTALTRRDFRNLSNYTRHFMINYSAAELAQMFRAAALQTLCELFGDLVHEEVIAQTTGFSILLAMAAAKKAKELELPPPPQDTPGTTAGYDLTEWCEEHPGLCCFLPEGPDDWWDQLLNNADFDYSSDGVTNRFGIGSSLSLGGGWSLNFSAGGENRVGVDDGQPVDGAYGSIGFGFGM